MGRPVESPDGRRAAVEFWVRMLNRETEVTLIGILFLRFAGRDGQLRGGPAGDVALQRRVTTLPHEGWGT